MSIFGFTLNRQTNEFHGVLKMGTKLKNGRVRVVVSESGEERRFPIHDEYWIDEEGNELRFVGTVLGPSMPAGFKELDHGCYEIEGELFKFDRDE